MPRFDLPQFLQVIQDQKSTFAFIAPPVAVALAKHPIVEQYELSTIRGMMSGAAPMSEPWPWRSRNGSACTCSRVTA